MPRPSFVAMDYLEAFYNLSMSRVAIGAPLVISDIKAYFEGTRMFSNFMDFLHIMQEADRTFLSKGNKK